MLEIRELIRRVQLGETDRRIARDLSLELGPPASLLLQRTTARPAVCDVIHTEPTVPHVREPRSLTASSAGRQRD